VVAFCGLEDGMLRQFRGIDGRSARVEKISTVCHRSDARGWLTLMPGVRSRHLVVSVGKNWIETYRLELCPVVLSSSPQRKSTVRTAFFF